MHDVIIIGGGPAGLTAAVYALRAGKSVVVIEKDAFGGQITWSPKVENFPALGPVSGTELGDMMTNRAIELGADMEIGEVLSIEETEDGKKVITDMDEEFTGKTVIIATGARPRMLGLEEEEKYVGNGECFCAVCDGAFYSGKPVAVSGGGNAALQDAIYLAEQCSHVYLIHRRDTFRGEEKLVESLKERENVTFVLSSQITAIHGDETLSGITVKDHEGRETDIAVEGLFVCVGREPANEGFANMMKLDDIGYAASDEKCLTPTEGVFVAGDCRQKNVRQLTTAVADGSVAALAACEYIDRM